MASASRRTVAMGGADDNDDLDDDMFVQQLLKKCLKWWDLNFFPPDGPLPVIVLHKTDGD